MLRNVSGSDETCRVALGRDVVRHLFDTCEVLCVAGNMIIVELADTVELSILLLNLKARTRISLHAFASFFFLCLFCSFLPFFAFALS